MQAQVVDILTDPFYYGAFSGAVSCIHGIHQPAVSKALMGQGCSRSTPAQPSAVAQDRKACVHTTSCVDPLRRVRCTRSPRESTLRQYRTATSTAWLYYRCTKKSSHQNALSRSSGRKTCSRSVRTSLVQLALPEDWVVPMLEQLESWSESETSRASAQLALLDLS